MTKVSIIIVNYDRPFLTVDCLNALEKQIFTDFEVVIVDNGSPKESVKILEKHFKQKHLNLKYKFLPINRNLGFSGGNNAGLEYAKGEFVALLNNDTEPHQNWLQELVKSMIACPDIGICASKILVHGTEIIDSAGDGFVRSLKGFKRGEGERSDIFCRKELVFGACAGAALYRKKMIDQVGFLDEEFFLIHEDSDFNFRAQLAGWKVLYVPTAIVYHKVRSSIGRWSDLEVYYTLRNSYLVKIKNAPIGLLAVCLPEILAATITEFIYFVIKHKRALLYFRAIGGALILLPNMLKKRKLNLHSRKSSNKYLRSMMEPIFCKGLLRAKLKKLLYD